MVLFPMLVMASLPPNDLKVVVLINGDQPMKGVNVTIDSFETTTTGIDGSFSISNYDLSQKPEKVLAFIEGFELSTWSFNNHILTIVMRQATIKSIEGLLIDANNIPLSNKRITYMGSTPQSIVSDTRGYYSLKIPINQAFDPKGKFEVDSKPVLIKKYINKGEKTITLDLQSLAVNYSIFNVEVVNSNGTMYSDQLITVGDESYVTDSNGQFRMSAFQNANVSWKFGNDKVQSIDTLTGSNNIRIVIKNQVIASALDSTNRHNDSIIGSISQEILFDMNELQFFYIEEEKILEAHRQQIKEINEKLPGLKEVNNDEKSQLNTQLNELNESMESTTKAFGETKRMHREFIQKLQVKLIEKNQVIKEIKEEKEELETQFNLNLQLFGSILFIVLTMLFGVSWALRKFKKQNILIQRTQEELLIAQEMAHIGNMTYNSDSKKFTYSDNFLNTLKIRNQEKVNRIQSATDELINEEIIAQEDRQKVKEKWAESLKSKEPISIEFKSNADVKKDVHIDMKTIFETNQEKQITRISSTLQDISSIKENEIKLISAINEAEKAGRIKEEFLASMSHEIRTPLNAIIGLTNRLLSQTPTDHQRKNLNIIEVSSEHLLALLNDVLDFSKIKAGKVRIEFTEFDLVEVITNTSNALLLNARERGIGLVIEENDQLPKIVKNDKLRINQVLMNLIGNAIKFTSDGSVTVRMTSKPSKANHHHITFAVIDTGIGIAEEKLESIFESFEQEKLSTSRQFGGTGLGLSISKSLVELLGGKLKVKSEINKGSEFYFTIEVEEIDKPKIKKDARSKTKTSNIYDLKGVKILCVEDNEINQMVISQYFNIFNVEADFANNGKEALEKFENNQYDVILMDIRLPDMTGYEISTKIKKDFPDNDTPIIAFTAEVDVKTEEKIKKAGMVDFLGKPFKEEELYNVISKHIAND